MPAPPRPRLAALRGLAFMALALPARADPRLQVAGDTCAPGTAGIERRLAGIFARAPSRALIAEVTFEASGDDVRVTVTTEEDSSARGTTAFAVSSCEEAVDAAVVVLSLALGADESEDATPVEAKPSEPSLEVPATPATSTLRVRLATQRPERDELPVTPEVDGTSRSSRVSLAGGVDLGTLPTPTAVVGAALTQAWPAVEVRAALHYGLPTANERVETNLRDSVQREFGAAGASLCRGLGAPVRFTTCAGGELGLVRVLRRVEQDGTLTLDEDQVSPRFSGVLTAILSLRHRGIRPELEVSAAALALGPREEASALAFRAAAGAAVDF